MWDRERRVGGDNDVDVVMGICCDDLVGCVCLLGLDGVFVWVGHGKTDGRNRLEYWLESMGGLVGGKKHGGWHCMRSDLMTLLMTCMKGMESGFGDIRASFFGFLFLFL